MGKNRPGAAYRSGRAACSLSVNRHSGEEPLRFHRPGPWVSVIPVEVKPSETGGDTARLPPKANKKNAKSRLEI